MPIHLINNSRCIPVVKIIYYSFAMTYIVNDHCRPNHFNDIHIFSRVASLNVLKMIISTPPHQMPKTTENVRNSQHVSYMLM